MKRACDHRSESQFKQLLKLRFAAMVACSFHSMIMFVKKIRDKLLIILFKAGIKIVLLFI